MDEEYGIIDVIRDIFETERVFFGTVRFLEGQTRNHIVAAHLRNTGMALNILRTYLDRPVSSGIRVTMNLADLSGNFFEPVPVIPTREQITNATEAHVAVTNTNCAICQESVTCATRIRSCGHCFHASCIDQWLALNTRCPVCRHDIREPLTNTPRITGNENRGVHPDTQ
jgi:hypothetical protein